MNEANNLTTQVSYRPIIFSSESVRRILGSLKTMTRRTRGLELINKAPDTWTYSFDAVTRQHRFYDAYYTDAPPLIIKCPYGQVGDRLWVRETWKQVTIQPPFCAEITQLRYKADCLDIPDTTYWAKWHSPRFMPRRASRILLEITSIRAERLQAITEEDAQAEGFGWYCGHPDCLNGRHWARGAFLQGWDSLNAKRGYGWERNNWVWPMGFKVLDITKPQCQTRLWQ